MQSNYYYLFIYIYIFFISGRKPFSCPQCSKTFRQQSNRDVHMYSHSGKTPFNCEFCDKQFVSKTLLSKHLTSSHGSTGNTVEQPSESQEKRCTSESKAGNNIINGNGLDHPLESQDSRLTSEIGKRCRGRPRKKHGKSKENNNRSRDIQKGSSDKEKEDDKRKLISRSSSLSQRSGRSSTSSPMGDGNKRVRPTRSHSRGKLFLKLSFTTLYIPFSGRDGPVNRFRTTLSHLYE